MPDILGFIIYDFNNIPLKYHSQILNILIFKNFVYFRLHVNELRNEFLIDSNCTRNKSFFINKMDAKISKQKMFKNSVKVSWFTY